MSRSNRAGAIRIELVWDWVWDIYIPSRVPFSPTFWIAATRKQHAFPAAYTYRVPNVELSMQEHVLLMAMIGSRMTWLLLSDHAHGGQNTIWGSHLLTAPMIPGINLI